MQLIHLMDEYFQKHTTGVIQESEKIYDWKKVDSPERLIKDYQFSSRTTALEFLRQLLLFEDQFNHHAKIVVEYDSVRIEVNTHGIEEVTKLDLDYAQTADQIFLDVAEYE